MPTVQIRELPTQPQGPNAELSFDQGGAYQLSLANPVPSDEEADLEWQRNWRICCKTTKSPSSC
jgi:hypothetical protein